MTAFALRRIPSGPGQPGLRIETEGAATIRRSPDDVAADGAGANLPYAPTTAMPDGGAMTDASPEGAATLKLRWEKLR